MSILFSSLKIKSVLIIISVNKISIFPPLRMHPVPKDLIIKLPWKSTGV
jgi:hypothetical protein